MSDANLRRSISGVLLLSFAFLIAAPCRGAGFAQGPRLLGTGAVGAAHQGVVAVSADGSTAIVGGAFDNTVNGSSTGAVWFFTRTSGSWSQQGPKIVGLNIVGGAQFGESVAISADGDTALVGGPQDASYVGAAWVFTRTNGVWSQQGGKLVGTGFSGQSSQGEAVALSADGNTALVGGSGDASATGAAWVFTRTNGVWSQQGPKLVGSLGTGAQQGTAVALSADGSTAAVGGFTDSANAGAVWIFARSAGTWTQQGGKLVGTGAAGAANQGYALALSANGNTLIEGGFADNSNAGAAWVFTRSGATWSQQGTKLVAGNATGNAAQAAGLALSGDGNTAVVGGPYDNTYQGAVWLFARSNGQWSQQGGKLLAMGTSGATPGLGVSMAMSSDGNTVIAGAANDSANAGGAYVFTRFCGHGDVNGDGLLAVADVFYLINYLFAGGAAPACY